MKIEYQNTSHQTAAMKRLFSPFNRPSIDNYLILFLLFPHIAFSRHLSREQSENIKVSENRLTIEFNWKSCLDKLNVENLERE